MQVTGHCYKRCYNFSPMDTFGEWLRGQRDALKLTREEFAGRIGCSIAMLRKIEDGERRPSRQIAELIAHSLDIPPEERGTFIKVARGELTTGRLKPISKPVHTRDIPSAGAFSKTNLPLLPTPLIGRGREVDELSKLLNDPQCRLLSLAGPGGIGKTRLAIETASQCQNAFADGVYFVPLAAVNAPRFIVPLIADSIGFVFQGEIDPRLQLFNFISEKQILLLADNLEHLLGDSEVVELFSELIEKTVSLKLLLTSRESLRLQNEWVFEVGGLPIPKGMDVEGTSVELFLQRARRASVGFEATSEDQPAILRICRLVNGMPLGIELAAAWVRTLSCAEIADELERGLDFLSVSAKDLPARHRSMRAVFDHSWKLLSEAEKNVLLRLSVFQGGFTRQAAQQVGDASLSILSALVSKSLIRRSGTGRYDLHELVRQYAFEQLANRPGVKTEALRRHATYFMAILRQEDMRLRSPAQREALAELLAEIDNIRSAQEWSLAQGEFDLIERTLTAYSTFFDILGWAQEGLDYLGRVLDVLDTKPSLSKGEHVTLAHLLTIRSLFAFRSAQHEEARQMLERGLELLRPLKEPRVLVEAVTFLGIIRIIMGDLAAASELFKEGLQTARDIGDQWFEALCLTELVGIDFLMGNAGDAHRQFQTALEAWHRTGDPRFTAFGLNSLSLSAAAIGEYEEAQAALEESIAINSSIGDRWGLGNAYRGLGLVAQAQEDHSRALDSFRLSLQIFTELGGRWDAARLLSEIGRSTLALGDDIEAERLWRESLRLAIESQGISIALEAVVGIASLHAWRGDHPSALRLVLVALSHPAMVQETKVRADALTTEIKAKLTRAEVEAAQRLAQDSAFESVVQEILSRAAKTNVEF